MQDLNFDAALFDSTLDRVNDHIVRSGFDDERDGFSLLENAESLALQSGGLARDRAHHLFD